jgi:hypothetical protein
VFDISLILAKFFSVLIVESEFYLLRELLSSPDNVVLGLFSLNVATLW